jgi:membrane protease subunit (stomatin/prohibitin family)
MGIFKIAGDSIGGTIREQWLESVEPAQMNTTTLMSYGMLKSKDGMRKNNKGSEDVISNGSVIHIPENVFMLLIDGGKIIAATDEPGYYRIDNSRSPSVFFKSENSYAVGQYSNALEQKRSGKKILEVMKFVEISLF